MDYYDCYDSPIGAILLVANEVGLSGAHFVGEKYYPEVDPDWQRNGKAKFIAAARKQLDEYFGGKRRHFEIEIAPDGTPFQRKVWRALTEIPFGATRSYGEIAARIGEPKASRAVGAANGRNPISIIVPCHRVIGANGDLTGYAGGLHRKQALLALESQHSGQARLL